MTNLSTITPGGLVLDSLAWVPTSYIQQVGVRIGGAPVIGGEPQLRSVDDFDVYQAVKCIINGGDFRGTAYFNRACKDLAAGKLVHHDSKTPKQIVDTEKRLINRLMNIMSYRGYQSGLGKDPLDEVGVYIDADGHLIKDFGGVHRFSVAKVNCLPRVLVSVRYRDPKWIEYLDYLQGFASSAVVGLYEQVPHPDLNRIKCVNQPMARAQKLIDMAGFGLETMVDIGANYGQMCHAFESAGYQCTAVENNPEIGSVLAKFKAALYCNFDIVTTSALDLPEIKADVVVAMSIFRHLVRQVGMAGFDAWLGKIDCKVLFMSMPRWPEDTKYRLKEWPGSDLDFAEHVAQKLEMRIHAEFEDGCAGRTRRGFVLRK